MAVIDEILKVVTTPFRRARRAIAPENPGTPPFIPEEQAPTARDMAYRFGRDDVGVESRDAMYKYGRDDGAGQVVPLTHRTQRATGTPGVVAPESRLYPDADSDPRDMAIQPRRVTPRALPPVVPVDGSVTHAGPGSFNDKPPEFDAARSAADVPPAPASPIDDVIAQENRRVARRAVSEATGGAFDPAPVASSPAAVPSRRKTQRRPLTEEERALLYPDREKPRPPDHTKDKPRGVWGEIKHRVEHAGKNAAAAMARGGGPVGALLGAGVGAVSPGMADRNFYKTFTERDWAEENAQAQKDAAATLDRAKDLADMSGYNPITGDALPETEERESRMDMQDAQRRNYENQEAGRIRDDERADRGQLITAFNAWERVAKKNDLIPDHFARALGIPVGSRVQREDAQRGEHYFRDNESGRVYQVKDGVAYDVTYGGKPFALTPKPERETRPTADEVESEAYEAALSAKGIKDPNADTANPKWQEEFNTLKAAAQSSSEQYGTQMPTDAQLATRVKAPRTIKAGDRVTRADIEREKAKIYRRNRGQQKNRPRASSPSQPSMRTVTREQVQGYADEHGMTYAAAKAAFEASAQKRGQKIEFVE